MATVTSSDLVTVQALTKRLAAFRPQDASQAALIAFMAGALHSLTRAIQCRFDDARVTPDLAAIQAELPDVLARIARSQEPPQPWLSGYYIDSAMLRIAALGERFGEHLGRDRPLDRQVPDAVNAMKHDLDAGITLGWDVRFTHVLKAVKDLWPLLSAVVPT